LPNRFLENLRRLRQVPMEYPASIGLSAFIHLLLLAVVNLLVDWPDPSHIHITRWDFEVAFGLRLAPQAKTASKPAGSGSTAGRQSPSMLPPASGNIQATASPTTPEAISPFPTEMASAPRAGENFSPGAATSGAADFSIESSPLTPALALEPRMPETALANIKLVPRRVAVSSPQRNAILKKVKKIVAKLPAFADSDSSFAWAKDGRRFQIAVRHVPAGSATGFDELSVTVSTVEGGDTLSTHMRMRRLAFSQFAQFVDYWDPQVALHADELDGRFHSNSALVLSASAGTQPKFHGKVTTAGYAMRSGATPFFPDPAKIFLAGIEEGAEGIPLPRVVLEIARDTAHVQTFVEETWITFQHDGSYSWRSASAPQVEHRAVLEQAPGCIVGKRKLHVKGTVKDKWLVYSENKIIIDDDLWYDRDPETSPASGDFLGLVSAKDVEIAPPEVTGPGDLKIYAAILAKGRFRVSDYYARNTGTLHLYGSLAAGSLSATEPRYATRVQFDKRFDKTRPPHFPMTDRYEINEWNEQWLVK
jgi:hypothetical protein